MSASNAGPGGVRNLRAMFENKASDLSTSPPSRGRSPNGSVSSSHSRPVSKVRTSFVAVEKPGEQGPSTPPSLRNSSDAAMDSSHESAVADGQDLGEILKGSPFVEQGGFEAQQQPESESNGVADRAAAMVKRIQQGSSEAPPSATVSAGANGNGVGSSANQSVKPARANQTKPSVEAKKSSVEPAKSSSESKNPPPAPRGPIVKPRGGGAKILGVMESAARAKAARESTAQQGGGYQAQDAEEPSGQAKEEKSTGFKPVKPKGGIGKIQGVMASAQRAKEARVSSVGEAPKEPTTSRPPRASLPARKLPLAATAPTTASAAKTSGETKPSEAKVADKKPTSAAPPRVANAATASSLAKKSSRASLNTNDTSKLRTSTTRPANDSFLARMTKPTASSAQRAHDKTTPQNRPHSRAAGAVKKEGTTRPSRKSLSQADENKDNETDIPDVPAIPETATTSAVPQQAEGSVESTGTQQAEETSTT